MTGVKGSLFVTVASPNIGGAVLQHPGLSLSRALNVY